MLAAWDAWHLLGMIALEARQYEASEQLIRRAMALHPADLDSTTAFRPSCKGRAVMTLRSNAAECKSAPPRRGRSARQLAEAHKAKGDIRNALACYEAALGLQEDFLICHSNRLMAMHYDPDISRGNVLRTWRWGELQRHIVQPHRHHGNDPDPAETGWAISHLISVNTL